MQVFLIVNNVGIKINADVNAKYCISKEWSIDNMKKTGLKGIWDKGFIWNPINCECECDKLCDVGEYLDYENFKCRKRLIDKLVEEWSEIIDGVKIAKITSMELHSTEDENECKSWCTIYVVLIVIVFTICNGIGTYFVYYKYMNHWYLKNDVSLIRFNTRT